MDAGKQRIRDSLTKVITKDVTKGKYLSDEAGKLALETILSRIHTTTNLEDISSVDLIIEAIAEDLSLKLSFYEKLGKIAMKDTIFASNTSSLPITAMAEISGRPEKFVGLHFFNPVQIMKLVEVIRTKHTSNEVFDSLVTFGEKIGKTAVRCKDTPGFIVNRLLVPYLAQALALYERGDASIQDIDVSMQLGAGHPMGPIQLADYVGLDTTLSILQGWKHTYPNDPAFIIPNILREMVNRGHLGRKSGRGFYEWKGDKVVGLAK